ncbi:hypothetical protein BpHYR1_008586 [Brachionus plicatilis]|uniref:Uncharacterized protein n=1 Tax=Brachionus plicatilis TaxID=10195 RepID=A0A3M7PN16_BRAPC|nr:hypothetical protein BpHYR1_008586 [Brachionus plicatilis]
MNPFWTFRVERADKACSSDTKTLLKCLPRTSVFVAQQSLQRAFMFIGGVVKCGIRNGRMARLLTSIICFKASKALSDLSLSLLFISSYKLRHTSSKALTPIIDRNQIVRKYEHIVSANVGHYFTQRNADTLSLSRALCIQAFFQYGQNVRQNSLAQLLDNVDQSGRRYLPLVVVRAGQTAEQNVKQGGQNFFESFGRIGDYYFPDVQRCLSHLQRCVRSSHVQARINPVPSLFSQRVYDRNGAFFCAKVVIFMRTLRGHFANHTTNLVQQISQQLHTGKSNSPIQVEQALFQLGQKQTNGTISIHVDNSLSGLDRSVPQKFRVIGQSFQNGLNDQTNLFDAQRAKHFTESLSSARPIHRANFGHQFFHQPRDYFGQAIFSDHFDHGAQSLGRHSPDLGHWVQQAELETGQYGRQVGHQVFLVGERVHVSHDLSCHLADFSGTVLEGSFDHWYYER